MKKLAFFAMTAIATASYALTPVGPGSIVITGTSTQLANVNSGSVVKNTSHAGSFASQNLASNQGLIDISGTSSQTAVVTHGIVTNEAMNGGDVAIQSLASNVGKVTIAKNSTQEAYVSNSTMTNKASGDGCDNCSDGTAA